MRRWIFLSVLLIFAGGSSPVFGVKPEDNQAARERGKLIYERSCIFCHGVEGKGDGSAGWFIGRYSSPRPRDFTAEGFKLRSTASGSLPTDQDLFRTVTQGIPGYMPPFSGLDEEERWQVVTYLKSFNPAFKDEIREPLTIGYPPFPSSEEAIAAGRIVYLAYGCVNCHGPNGKGDGKESLESNLKDARGLRVQASDLTAPTSFKNGATARDLYRSMMTGLDGTPMPSFANQFPGKDIEAWGLVYYILSLSAERKP
jgi:mono/diheme cytochrome c family protein